MKVRKPALTSEVVLFCGLKEGLFKRRSKEWGEDNRIASGTCIKQDVSLQCVLQMDVVYTPF
jgi:hypothetical protein